MEISGKTKIMFILADPVAHIRGSVVLTRELRALGHDIAISPLHVKPADLERRPCGRSARSRTWSVSASPSRTRSPSPLHRRAAAAGEAGRLGQFRAPRGRRAPDRRQYRRRRLHRRRPGERHRLPGKRVLQLGAGGAGRSIAFSIAAAGARRSALQPHRGQGCAISPRRSSRVPRLRCLRRTGRREGLRCRGEHHVPRHEAGRSAAGRSISPDAGHERVGDHHVAGDDPAAAEAQRRGCRISLGRSMLENQVKRLEALLGPFKSALPDYENAKSPAFKATRLTCSMTSVSLRSRLMTTSPPR